MSVAAATYTGDDGEEEMHVFFAMGSFDVGSWAWAHYIAEWGTKGVFAVSEKTSRAFFAVTESKCHIWHYQ